MYSIVAAFTPVHASKKPRELFRPVLGWEEKGGGREKGRDRITLPSERVAPEEDLPSRKITSGALKFARVEATIAREGSRE